MRDDPLTDEQKQLVAEHVELAERLARRRHRKNPCVALEDQVQDACLGLIDAARGFDPAEGVEFEAYAYRRIMGAMIDAERTAGVGPAVKIGRFARRNGAPEIKVTSIELLNAQGKHGWRRLLAADILFVDHAPPVAESVERRDAVDAALAGLPKPLREIVRSCWIDGKTQKQAGVESGVSESRASQLMTAAILRLREHRALASYAEVA